MRFPRKAKPFTGQLDVAAFVSVLFLVVLFLLLHTSLAPAPGIRIQLPTVALPANPPPTVPTLTVVLDQREQAYFEHQAVSLDELRKRVAQRVQASAEPLTLLVQADETVQHAALLRVSAAAVEAGVREVMLGTRPPLFPPASAGARQP
jgi:biopolymer transport protein ExbD